MLPEDKLINIWSEKCKSAVPYKPWYSGYFGNWTVFGDPYFFAKIRVWYPEGHFVPNWRKINRVEIARSHYLKQYLLFICSLGTNYHCVHLSWFYFLCITISWILLAGDVDVITPQPLAKKSYRQETDHVGRGRCFHVVQEYWGSDWVATQVHAWNSQCLKAPGTGSWVSYVKNLRKVCN